MAQNQEPAIGSCPSGSEGEGFGKRASVNDAVKGSKAEGSLCFREGWILVPALSFLKEAFHI
jgi:hypothetical protein